MRKVGLRLWLAQVKERWHVLSPVELCTADNHFEISYGKALDPLLFFCALAGAWTLRRLNLPDWASLAILGIEQHHPPARQVSVHDPE